MDDVIIVNGCFAGPRHALALPFFSEVIGEKGKPSHLTFCFWKQQTTNKLTTMAPTPASPIDLTKEPAKEPPIATMETPRTTTSKELDLEDEEWKNALASGEGESPRNFLRGFVLLHR